MFQWARENTCGNGCIDNTSYNTSYNRYEHRDIFLVFKKYRFLLKNTGLWASKYRFVFPEVGMSGWVTCTITFNIAKVLEMHAPNNQLVKSTWRTLPKLGIVLAHFYYSEIPNLFWWVICDVSLCIATCLHKSSRHSSWVCVKWGMHSMHDQLAVLLMMFTSTLVFLVAIAHVLRWSIYEVYEDALSRTGLAHIAAVKWSDEFSQLADKWIEFESVPLARYRYR